MTVRTQQKRTSILGISAFYHDSAAALICDGEIVAAAQEERFTRKKHDPSFPSNAARFCLEESGIALEDLDAVVFYDKPLLKFERLLETYYAYAPKGLRSFVSAIPVWIKEKLFLKDLLVKELKKIGSFDRARTKLLFSGHHLSHAASAFYPSPFKSAAVLTIDGVGEWATAVIARGEGEKVTIARQMRFPHSVGLLYSAFTYYLGFRVNSGEYKLMGLSPYGDPTSERVRNYIDAIKRSIVRIKDDGSIWMDQAYFEYATGLVMVNEGKWEELFGFPRRKPEGEIEQQHADFALAAQKVTEEIVVAMARTARSLTGEKNLCLAGGVALNCVANARILKEKIFDSLWIQPAAGDAGGALGAAYAVYHAYFGKPRALKEGLDAMKGSFLGPEFSDMEIDRFVRKYRAVSKPHENEASLVDAVASRLAEGKVVGWFQGRMEFGPRSLGARSILGDARSKDMQKRLNLKIKYRESFRPFAPSVLYEDAGEYYELSCPSPYMLLVADVVKKRRNALPDGYHKLPTREKLYYARSDIPAVTHLDFSARVQTVHKETNRRYWALIDAFKKKTGFATIVNTSFNVRGEPIVCVPDDAYRCFMRTEMDSLVMGTRLFDKTEQPEWRESKKWKEELILD